MAVIARVFPRKTKYTPTDPLVFFSVPGLWERECYYDEVHVSCTFTWDKQVAERLAEEWLVVCDTVKLGGPAYDDPGGEFTPGFYVREGYVNTSRGCCRRCSFCLVPGREGMVREYSIPEGPWVLDNNLLACSRSHVKAVFDMLERQRDVRFFGGIDVRILSDWHVDRISKLSKRLRYLYIAYDQDSQKDAVESALIRFYEAGLKRTHLGCYVLVGFDGDTVREADRRCEWVFVHGGQPFAMYYRSSEEESSRKPPEWGELTRRWMWQSSIYKHIKSEGLRYHKTILRGDLAGTDGRK